MSEIKRLEWTVRVDSACSEQQVGVLKVTREWQK